MKVLHYSLQCLLFIVCALANCHAQHEHPPAKSDRPSLEFSPVLTTFLSDPELQKFKLDSRVLTIAPGGTDTVSHRHDADVFGYVMEGAIELGLEFKEPVTFKAGQMFHEKRNIIHSFLRNSHTGSSKILLIFIIKDGRQGYTRLYPEK